MIHKNWMLAACLLLLTTVGFSNDSYTLIPDEASVPTLSPTFAHVKQAKVRLKNGLEILLISDPEATESAASVAVEAGSWHDPVEYPGMAHFLEHMLFMGTQAYPNETAYGQYISDNGGTYNAYTASDRTVYMFSIPNGSFTEAFDRFSHFFIDPLLSAHCVARELHAVDEEHAKNLENDDWRQYMIFKETGNPQHPNHHFSTGNASTLSNIPPEALRSWFHAHYLPERMHLVIISPLSLEQQLPLATEAFAKVPCHTPPTEQAQMLPPLSSSAQRGHLIAVEPVKEVQKLSIMWEVTREMAEDLESKSMELVANALAHEGDHGLISQLKREGLAESLTIGVERLSHSSAFFIVDVDLTQEGLAQRHQVTLRTFQAIARLRERGIPPYLFEEMQSMAKLRYQWPSREGTFHRIQQLAHAMCDEQLSTFPEKTLIPTTYNPLLCHTFIQSLTPENSIQFLTASAAKTGIALTHSEQWMSTRYAIQPLSKEELDALRSATPHKRIDLPTANPFVPEHLSLLPIAKDSEVGLNLPVVIADDGSARIFFIQDQHYFVPEVSALFHIKSPLLNGSATSYVLADLYERHLRDKLSDLCDQANRAGLQVICTHDALFWIIEISGYNSKAPLLIKEIFSSLKGGSLSKAQFAQYKASLLSEYENEQQELPISQAYDLAQSLLSNDTLTGATKADALRNIRHEEYRSFAKQLWAQTYTEGTLYGNMDAQSAKTFWIEVQQRFAMEPFVKAEHPKNRVLLLPDASGPYLVMQPTARRGNGALLVLEQGRATFEARAAHQILGRALKEAFFDTLRTKQQTAYIAKAWDVEKEKQLLQFFAVQSQHYHPTELLARFELFLEEFRQHLPERISNQRFETIQKAAILLLQTPPESQRRMVDLYHALAFQREDFQWREKRIAALENLTYAQFLKSAQQFLSRTSSRRLAILVPGLVPPDKAFHYEVVTADQIKALGTYSSAH